MIAYADTSFVVALFAGEATQWRKAWKWWHAAGLCQVMVSRLTLMESENAFHALRVDHKITTAELRVAQHGLLRARMEALLVRRETPAHRLYPEAHRLVTHHSARAAYGALDILHVAAALILRAGTLLTFDKQQAALARAAGLRTAPDTA
jgi:predicted nucleic acid-binding protein